MATSGGKDENHYHAHKTRYTAEGKQQQLHRQMPQQQSTASKKRQYDSAVGSEKTVTDTERKQEATRAYDLDDRGFRRIIRDFSPSYGSLCHNIL